VRPVTQDLFSSLMLDEWPRMAARVDFGLDTQEHYEALYYPVRAGEITVDQLEAALGSGPQLTALARAARSNPHREIVFRTAWDNLTEEGE